MSIFILFIINIQINPTYYTNNNYYYEITGRDSLIYGATNGGVVRYNHLTKTFATLTSLNGLRINRQKCVALDSTGYIWTGNELGIGVINAGFTSAESYPVDDNNINTIYCLHDTVFIGTTGGLLRIETKRPNDFGDDITMRIYQLNGLPSDYVTVICSDDSSIWVGTDKGLVRFDKNFYQSTYYNLNNIWITGITVIDTNIFVSCQTGLYGFSIDHFDTLLQNCMIWDMSNIGDSLILAMEPTCQVGIFYQGHLDTIASGLPSLVKVNCVTALNNVMYCGLANQWNKDYFGEGIGEYSVSNVRWNLTTNNCIGSNHISCITANEHGVFVAHGNRSQLSKGFSWLKNNGEWGRYTRDSIVPFNHVHRCVTAPDGRVWFATNAFDPSDSMIAFAMDPVTNEWTYIPDGYHNMDRTTGVWDIEIDSSCNLFLSLAGQQADRCWVIDSALASVCALAPKQEGFFCETAIDSSGKIWRTIAEQPGGLVVTDTKNTLFNTSDDEFNFYSSPGGYTKNLRGCVVDQNNNLYIATPVGLLIYDSSVFMNLSNVSSQDLFDVELDSEGRVWIMARDGVYWYDPRTGNLSGQRYRDIGAYVDFDTTDKEVIQTQGFEFDPIRRCFWVGAETGLLKLEIEIDTTGLLDSVIIYPNPVVRENVVRIKNLPLDARLKIYSITGRLLNPNDLTPDNTFGEVVWTIPNDARSGLYFILIKSGQNKKVCKFAIIK